MRANATVHGRKSLAHQTASSPFAGVTGLGVPRRKTDIPDEAERAGFDLEFVACAQQMLCHLLLGFA